MSTVTYGSTLVLQKRPRTRMSLTLDQKVLLSLFSILGCLLALVATALILACLARPAKTMVATATMQIQNISSVTTTGETQQSEGKIFIEKIKAEFGTGLDQNALVVHTTVRNDLPYEVSFSHFVRPISIVFNGKLVTCTYSTLGGYVKPGESQTFHFQTVPLGFENPQPGETYSVYLALNLVGVRRPEPGVVIDDGPPEFCSATTNVTKPIPMARRLAAR